MPTGQPSPQPQPIRSTAPKTSVPGYSKFRKYPLDAACFDFEEILQYLCTPIVVDSNGKKGLPAQAVFLVDPCQSAQTPLKTATILPHGVNLNSSSFAPGGLASLGVWLEGLEQIPDGSNTGGVLNQILQHNGSIQVRALSALNTAKSVVLGLEDIRTVLSVSMVATGGTATVLVEGSTDNTNYITCDSIAAALSTAVSYHSGGKMTSAALTQTSTGLNPLAFRFIRVTAGAAGVGFATQLDIGAK